MTRANEEDQIGFTAPPIVIIGAARSGTKLLRNILTRLKGVTTWPCDEINPIWLYSNHDLGHDELSAEHATPKVVRYIRRCFLAQYTKPGVDVVVEKTCANSLRVDFVHKIIPEGRFVFIYRNGVDVTASAMQQWHAKPRLGYTLRKARFVPLSQILYHGSRWLWNRANQLWSPESRLSMWGPRFRGFEEFLTTWGLPATCAKQWGTSVERSLDDLAQLPPEQMYSLSYEELVADPFATVTELLAFLRLPTPLKGMDRLIGDVRRDSVGKGYGDITPSTRSTIEPFLREAQQRLGYE